ncbi:PH domain-containing protein [Bifidobacterium pullorum subsp. saeculare]|uniref:PH domain-containing protein n=1 Tax=Bifidobacterium pullorum subsp. saeculare TaxID=78257 RepID=A0A938WYZ2_9BIFI|nr:PH domain-containing protein [Bifidobacterium pullorum]MBM6700185.1 PH domain-containing protein [Bifidobacterium pullorum subsp. saeculare]
MDRETSGMRRADADGACADADNRGGYVWDRAGRDEREWQRPPERITRAWMVQGLIMAAALAAAAVVTAAVCQINGWWNFWTVALAVVLAVLAVAALASIPVSNRYDYEFNQFSIGERDVRIRKGWLFRSMTTVPYNRVQHVDTKQGPVLRAFGLMTVQVHTAVGEHEIEGLDVDQAHRVVELIAARAREAKEDL